MPPHPSAASPRPHVAPVRVVAGLRTEDLAEMEAPLQQALELATDDRLTVERHIGVDSAELAGVLFADADIVLLDGHGLKQPPGMCGLELDLEALQRLSGRPGIRAPVLISGACWAGGRWIAPALQRCLARPSTVLVASREGTYYVHSARVFPQVLRALAPLGPSPDPAAAFEVLRGLAVLAGDQPRGWGVRLLRRETAGTSGDDTPGHR